MCISNQCTHMQRLFGSFLHDNSKSLHSTMWEDFAVTGHLSLQSISQQPALPNVPTHTHRTDCYITHVHMAPHALTIKHNSTSQTLFTEPALRKLRADLRLDVRCAVAGCRAASGLSSCSDQTTLNRDLDLCQSSASCVVPVSLLVGGLGAR